jgi:hypothetical protein
MSPRAPSLLRRLAPALMAVGAAVGCAPSLPSPKISSVSPSWGYNGAATEVEITGVQLFPQVEVSGADAVQLDHRFEARLRGPTTQALSNVVALDFESLTATVPAGMQPGAYDLELVAPTGEVARLEGAFAVTDSPAHHLLVSLSSLTPVAEALVEVQVQVADPDGAPVALALPILARLNGEVEGLQFAETLDEHRIEEGVLYGRLDAAGRGTLAFTVAEPGAVELEVQAAEASSIIAGVHQALQIVPGLVSAVEVALPEGGRAVDEPFDVELVLRDEDGNPTEGVVGIALLTERCGEAGQRYAEQVNIADRAVVTDVLLSGATSREDCPDNQLLVQVIAQGTVIEGASEPFSVAPGRGHHLALEARPATAVAGQDPVLVTVDVVDSWGNPTEDATRGLVLADTEGGLIPGVAGEQTCTAVEGGQAWCSAVLWAAGSAVQIRGMSLETGLVGDSNPIEILPHAPVGIEVAVEEGPIEAGDAMAVRARVVDTWGNGIDLALSDHGRLFVEDVGGAVPCVPVGDDGADGQRLSCQVTRASETAVLRVHVPRLGVEGASAPFVVVNGPLTQAIVDLDGASAVTAGQDLTLSIQTTDAWGNPYREQTVTSVELADASGDIAGQTALIDAFGVARPIVRFTRVWKNNQLTVTAGRAVLGLSPFFDVEAGPTAGYRLDLASTWATLDAPLPVWITAVDAFGNTVTGHEAPLVLSSHQGLGPPLPLSGFVDGMLLAEFSFDLLGLQDLLRVSDGLLTGVSTALDVVDLHCAQAPIASLDVDGSAVLVACRTTGTTATSTLGASGSMAAGSALVAYHFEPDGQGWLRQSSDARSWAWDREGGYLAQLLVVDANACASTAAANVWVADDDGEPAGPITLSSTLSTLINGSPSAGSTAVQVTAQDCAGDRAAGGTVYLRSSRGDLSSGTSSLVATGAGLVVVLDAAGEGEVDFDVLSNRFEGSAAIHAGVLSSAAHGELAIALTSDAAAPLVLAQDPTGLSTSPVQAITLVFSDSMLPSSFTSSTLVITDPLGMPLTDVVPSWSADRTTLTLTAPVPLDTGLGQWTLALSSQISDAAGNRLDGQFAGTASPYAGVFGLVPSTAPNLLSCPPDVALFRPDGDDGAGEESDDVHFSAVSDAVPEFFEVRVTDGEGVERWRWREAGAAAAQLLSWSGVDQDGAVVENGVFGVQVSAWDALGNEGDPCFTEVEVENLVRAPG